MALRHPGINVVARPGYTAPDARRVERDKRELTKRERAEKEKVAREQAKPELREFEPTVLWLQTLEQLLSDA